jgi:hypothetical protein
MGIGGGVVFVLGKKLKMCETIRVVFNELPPVQERCNAIDGYLVLSKR